MNTRNQHKSRSSRKDSAVDSKDVSVDSNDSVSFKPTDCQRNTETSLNTQNNPNQASTRDNSGQTQDVKRCQRQYDVDEATVRRIAKQRGFEKVTDQQVQWLVAYLNSAPDAKDSEITERCGFYPKTVGRWWLKDAWVDLVVRVAESRARKGLARVWQALEDKAASGDKHAIGLYLQRFDGEYLRSLHVPAVDPQDKALREQAQKAIRAMTDKRRTKSSKAKTS
jgi:hypothetical protein